MHFQTARRWYTSLALLVVIALLLAACGGGEPAPTAVASQATEVATEAAAASDTTQATEAAAAIAIVPPPAEVAEGEANKVEPAARVDMYTEAPAMTIDPSKVYYATFKTDKGDIKAELFADRAPNTVNNFVYLARDGFYNDTTFHRVIDSFMAQAGDPTGTGMGGPGYQFADEIYPGGAFDRPGLLAMANSGPNTNGSQFFITFAPTDWLNNLHTIFGEVIEGQDVLDKITRRDPQADTGTPGDKLYTVIIEESDTSTLPTPTALPPTPTPFAPSSVTPTDRPLANVAPDKKTAYFNTEPAMVIDTAKGYTATLSTAKGDMVIALYDDFAPTAVNNFVTLANLGFYDNSTINDINPGQLVVFGSPTGDPAADAGYVIKPEVGLPISPTVGALTYRSIGQDPEAKVVASSSQLFLALSDPPAEANASYSFFGQIVEGLDILPTLAVSDTINSITIEEK